ncbi:MAG: tetratricopeptide repeat protein [Crocinitomicaceae bacterium]
MNRLLLVMIILLSFKALCQNNTLKNMYNGNMLYSNAFYEEAIEEYEKITASLPFHFKSNYNLGNSNFRLKEYDKAIEHYESIVEKGKTKSLNADIYHNIGNCYVMKNEFEAAIQAYKNSLKLNPFAEDTRYNLAFAMKILEEQKKKEEKNQEQKENSDQDEKNEEQNSENAEKSDDKSDKNQEPEDKQDKEKNDVKENNQQDKDIDEKNKKEQKNKPDMLSKEQAKRLLEAAARAEKEIQEKKDEKLKIGTGKPKAKKDW